MKIKKLAILFLIILTVLKVKTALTQEEKDTFLDFYMKNRYTSNDTKKNIKEIYWDDELASKAQNTANTCSAVPININRKNIESNYNETELFNLIMKQKDGNNESNYKAKFKSGMSRGQNTDNSSQLVTKLGCGLTDCTLKGMVPSFFMECKFKTGNITGTEVYTLESNTISFGLTQEQKNSLINLHRQARVAVNASNMKELNWDDKLAEDAQNYANTCPGLIHSGRGPENIAAAEWATVEDLFNSFMEEKDDFDRSNYREKLLDDTYNSKEVGHYSQIVWASNTEFGCGLTDCSSKGSYKVFMVCRYRFGNVVGSEVYALGNSTTTISTTTIIKPTTTTTTIITTSTTNIKPTTNVLKPSMTTTLKSTTTKKITTTIKKTITTKKTTKKSTKKSTTKSTKKSTTTKRT